MTTAHIARAKVYSVLIATIVTALVTGLVFSSSIGSADEPHTAEQMETTSADMDIPWFGGLEHGANNAMRNVQETVPPCQVPSRTGSSLSG